MTTERRCRQCGGLVPPDAPLGSCPACLLRAGLDQNPVEPGPARFVGMVPCPECRAVLQLPAAAAGRRLKCPKCAHKFRAPGAPARPSPSPSRSASSTILVNTVPDEPELPEVPGSLREAFDLPLWTGGESSPTRPSTASALALFEGDARPLPRPARHAEARSRGRRCPTCGAGVPAGMSLCASCGLDLETGRRIVPVDDLLPEAPRRAPGMPIAGAVVGGTCALGSLILALVTIRQWLLGVSGWQYFVPACLFGLFASVQYLRGQSARLLLVALTIGALIDVVALIALPVAYANMETQVVSSEREPGGEDVAIASVADRLDTGRLGLGVTFLILYAGVSVYLLSPTARRHLVR